MCTHACSHSICKLSTLLIQGILHLFLLAYIASAVLKFRHPNIYYWSEASQRMLWQDDEHFRYPFKVDMHKSICVQILRSIIEHNAFDFSFNAACFHHCF